MIRTLTIFTVAIVVLIAAFTAGRFTASPDVPSQKEIRAELSELETTKSWLRLVEVIETAGLQVLGQGDNSALDRQDAIERYLGLLTILSNTTRMPLNSDPTRPLMETFDLLPPLSKIGGNSPDADYHGFPVSSDHSYRIRGTRGMAPFFALQVQSREIDYVRMQPRMYLASVLADEQLTYDGQGYFNVLVSKDRPENHDGLWLGMDDNSFRVVIREYHHDREAEGEPDLTVEFLGEAPAPTPLGDEEVSRLLQQAAFMSKFWFEARDWYPDLREPEAVNRFQVSEAGTDTRSQDLALAADVQYMLGWWKLAEDESLVIEGKAPDSPYWNIQLTDRWLETAEFRRRQVNLNNSQIRVDQHGKYRIVISSKNPGLANWLDNGGRSEGLMAFRWAYAENFVPPSTKVIKTASLEQPGTR
ncbi:MAG: hypothetical protein Hals2KO_05380 [Halioglobus sp.]